MKKIAAIVIIVITLLVTIYNTFQFVTGYGIKPETHDERPAKEQPREDPDKGLVGAYIVFNFSCFTLMGFAYNTFLKMKGKYPNDEFKLIDKKIETYWNVLFNSDGYYAWYSLPMGVFCAINGLAIFIFLSTQVSKLL